jgi:hypothetical protein
MVERGGAREHKSSKNGREQHGETSPECNNPQRITTQPKLWFLPPHRQVVSRASLATVTAM